jgi:regulator of protease activity HflC (stomatin/prohibitin superfamily)
MKKIIILIASMFILFACSKVPAGNVGIKVYLLGGEKGVQSETLGVGRYWIGVNEELFLYPTYTMVYNFTQDANEDSPDDEAVRVQTKDGVSGNFDFAIQCNADEKLASVLFQKYRKDFKDVIKVNLRNYFRDAINEKARHMTVDDLYSAKINEAVKEVENDMISNFRKEGIIVEKVSILGRVRLPEELEAAITAKMKATQEALQRENDVQKAKADAEIRITAAKAEAESIQMRQRVITEELIRYEAVQKWDGKLPETMIPGSSVPFIGTVK